MDIQVATDFHGYHFRGCHRGGGEAPGNVIYNDPAKPILFSIFPELFVYI